MMSSLYVGLSGLTNSSNALNTTANNLANVNTKGYVRQQVVFEDRPYNAVAKFATNTLQQGLGVTIQDVEHVRDILLDEAYRRENGREGFYKKLTDATTEIQAQLGELNDVSYQNTIRDLLSAVNEVAKTPDDNVARAALVQSSIVFLDRSQSIYNGLVQYQNNLNNSIYGMIDRINEIGYRIMDLNKHISSLESGVETAMTMRDERDLLLDELSEYVKINTTEDASGTTTVFIEGVFFCNQLDVSEIGAEVMGDSGFYRPIWKEMNDEPLYNMNVDMATDKNTDIGSLKGLLAARGSISPTFAMMKELNKPATWPDGPDKADYDLTTAAGSAAYEADLKEYKEYRDYRYYEESKECSIVARSIANFDKLVNGIVSQINEVLSPTTQITDDGGNVYTVLNEKKCGYGKDANQTPGTELFSRKYTERYKKVNLTVGGVTSEYYVYNEKNGFGNKSAYSVSNLEINPKILHDNTLIPLNGADGKVDYEKAKELVAIFSKDCLTFRDGLEKFTFEEFYESFVNDIGTEGKMYESMVDSQQVLTGSIDDGRQQIMAVASDEELTNMIRYQQAYNAASRYINVVTTMMDTIIGLMM